jgi:hypothetical protein
MENYPFWIILMKVFAAVLCKFWVWNLKLCLLKVSPGILFGGGKLESYIIVLPEDSLLICASGSSVFLEVSISEVQSFHVDYFFQTKTLHSQSLLDSKFLARYCLKLTMEVLFYTSDFWLLNFLFFFQISF